MGSNPIAPTTCPLSFPSLFGLGPGKKFPGPSKFPLDKLKPLCYNNNTVEGAMATLNE